MFLHLLDHAQRREFCRAALFLVSADGVVDLREEEVLARARAELGYTDPEDLPLPPKDIDELLGHLEVFETTESRRALVLELVVLVLADGDVDEEEMDGIAAICNRLDVSREDYARLKAFARRLLDLRADGLELITGA
jgi:uncharacterized tellurite resistance protein B-like protein